MVIDDKLIVHSDLIYSSIIHSSSKITNSGTYLPLLHSHVPHTTVPFVHRILLGSYREGGGKGGEGE